MVLIFQNQKNRFGFSKPKLKQKKNRFWFSKTKILALINQTKIKLKPKPGQHWWQNIKNIYKK
jgi:hypothetical protein